MNKIFKYKLNQDYTCNSWWAEMPKNIQILRMGEVHDDYYDGTFLWGIVDTEDKNVIQQVNYFPTKETDYSSFQSTNLAIREKQQVNIKPDKIVGVKDVDGFLKLYYRSYYYNGISNIAFYKTGQNIDIPVERLKYIGMCRLYIMQELMLYAFLVKD